MLEKQLQKSNQLHRSTHNTNMHTYTGHLQSAITKPHNIKIPTRYLIKSTSGSGMCYRVIWHSGWRYPFPESNMMKNNVLKRTF